MRTSPRVIGAAAGVLALVVSGCTSSTADPRDETESVSPVATASPSPAASEEASPSGSASPGDPFAVPDPVTEEYVDRVVNTLYEEWGAIIRGILEQPADPSGITDVETRERIAALFDGQYLLRRYEESDKLLRGDREGVLPAGEKGQLRFKARRVFVGSGECLIVAGDVSTDETAVEPEWTLSTLSLSPTASNASRSNPTGWRIIDLVTNVRDGEPMADEVMLNASWSDFDGVLDHSCEEGTEWGR